MASATVKVEISEQQIVEMVDQLSLSAKQEILKRLIISYEQWEAITDAAAVRMRQLCAERGIDWDRLSEEERLALIDTLLHEA